MGIEGQPDLGAREKGDRADGGAVSAAQDLALLHQLAREQTLAGHFLEAQSSCQQAFALDPENAETLHLMAVVHSEARQFDHAVEWASRAIRRDPKPAYLTTLGVALMSLGRNEDALKVFDKAVQLRPDDGELWWHMGNALIRAERSADALLCFRHTLTLNPRHGDAAYKAGHLLHGLGQSEEALVYLDLSAELQPDHAPTSHLRAVVLKNLNRFEEAMADNVRAIGLDPTNADTYGNMGNVLQALGRHEEALSWYDRSLTIRPNVTSATRRAMSLTELGRFDEAMAAYQRSLSIDPHHATTIFNCSLLQLLMGDFEAGWRGREARWRIPELAAAYPKFSTPMWLGKEPVAGKTIFVCEGEGMGDAIQFARYVPMLAAQGGRVILVVNEQLCPVLSRLSGVSQCLPKLSGMVAPPFDFHVAIDSLPLAFGTRLDSIPAETYLPRPDADRVQAWENRLGRRDKLRVGLVWSGNPKHVNDRSRSMPLRMLSGLLEVDATFVSLQKNPRPHDAKTLRERAEILDHTAYLSDFVETAALVSCLDLVITVDTSVAHLAGALGCPTWVLLAYVPDWRWLLDRDDSPWYPTVRLFRQTATRDYGSVLDRVRAELIELIDARKSSGSTPYMP